MHRKSEGLPSPRAVLTWSFGLLVLALTGLDLYDRLTGCPGEGSAAKAAVAEAGVAR